MMAKPRKATANKSKVTEAPPILDNNDNDKKRRKRDALSIIFVGLVVMVLLCVVAFKDALPETQSLPMLALQQEQTATTSAKSPGKVVIPECQVSPWKPDEDLVGTCPGDLKPYKIENDKNISKEEEGAAIVACATACCALQDCITWQYRADVGCKHGRDVRIGMEKDGPAAYCSAHPPYRWQGQFVSKRKETQEEQQARHQKACSTSTWNPNEQPGQCFGLGDVRKKDDASKSARNCMEACCADSACGAWQFQKELGCFYGKGMHSCQPSNDPIVFEPFVGRRKIQSGRTYGTW